MVDSRIDELRRRLERDPGSRLFAQLAEEHRKAGDHAEAVRVSRAGLAQHPNYPSARLTLGRALLESGDAAAARRELEQALREAPDNILASRFLGQALEAVGALGEALLQYGATLKMAPGDRQLEAQVQTLKARLTTAAVPAARSEPRPAPSPPVMARPAMPAVVRPTAAAAPPAAGSELPATVLLKGPERPRPPVPGAGAAPAAPPAVDAPPPTLPLGRAPMRASPPPASASADPVITLKPASRGAQPEFGDTEPARQVPAVIAALPSAVPPPEAEPQPRPQPKAGAAELPAVDAGTGAAPLSSSTLAELYLRQGLPEQAVEVYRQVLSEDPGNERARARLAEIAGPAASLGALAAATDDPRAARRRVLERTIAGLEALLASLQRR